MVHIAKQTHVKKSTVHTPDQRADNRLVTHVTRKRRANFDLVFDFERLGGRQGVNFLQRFFLACFRYVFESRRPVEFFATTVLHITPMVVLSTNH
jgi:hypothetical protein